MAASAVNILIVDAGISFLSTFFEKIIWPFESETRTASRSPIRCSKSSNFAQKRCVGLKKRRRRRRRNEMNLKAKLNIHKTFKVPNCQNRGC
jgi:hypothetical protein